MSVRGAVALMVFAGCVVPSAAGEMNAAQAHRFVVGKLFAFTCFEGTSGAGRVHADGSASGMVRFQGAGPFKHMTLPPGTLRVKGDNVCAAVKGMSSEPCFDLRQTDTRSFRGSLQGFNFAFCDFTRRGRIGVADADDSKPAVRGSTRLAGSADD